ncbi:glutamine-hydrolyzing carbamoyl-phosphate synthase small subunit [Mollicutes bacterium LVI A0039]|nr:glutamine-hydrolyzing carbamoyl-phosphate synthase small subunit [Mollicutes bacterium LVI A0039]
MKKVKLVLENGMSFTADNFGYEVSRTEISEIIFTTSMSGYQEVITDPSYYKQMVVMTYPIVGNYGLNATDFESSKPYLSALIVNEYTEMYSHADANQSLADYLKEHKVPGLCGLDTRELTNVIRNSGCLRAIIVPIDTEVSSLEADLKAWTYTNHVADVSTKVSYVCPGPNYRVALIDCGCKKHIIQKLSKYGCEIIVMPYNSTSEQILKLDADGVMFSNGPGDPKDVPETIKLFKDLHGKLPIFGICLGHQIFALSMGANTSKMKFGHHSSNHPVKDLDLDTILTTTQNHGYAVDKIDLEAHNLRLTHVSLNDDSVEGIESLDKMSYTVQFHPEGNQGPSHDQLFEKFINRMKEEKNA